MGVSPSAAKVPRGRGVTHRRARKPMRRRAPPAPPGRRPDGPARSRPTPPPGRCGAGCPGAGVPMEQDVSRAGTPGLGAVGRRGAAVSTTSGPAGGRSRRPLAAAGAGGRRPLLGPVSAAGGRRPLRGRARVLQMLGRRRPAPPGRPVAARVWCGVRGAAPVCGSAFNGVGGQARSPCHVAAAGVGALRGRGRRGPLSVRAAAWTLLRRPGPGWARVRLPGRCHFRPMSWQAALRASVQISSMV